MKLKSLLIASALLFSTSLFAEVGGGNSGTGNTTQVAGGTVNSANGIYTVTVSPDKKATTIAALDGEVTLTRADGTSVKIDIGSGRVIGADGKETTQTLAEIVAAEKAAGNATGANSVTASLTAALKVVADNTAAGKYGDGATTLLASLVKVMSVANPDAAVEYVTTAVSAVTSPDSGAINKGNAAMAIAQAATASKSGMAADGVFFSAALKAANANGVTNLAGKATLNLIRNLDPKSYTVMKSSTPITPIDPTVISPSGGSGD